MNVKYRAWHRVNYMTGLEIAECIFTVIYLDEIYIRSKRETKRLKYEIIWLNCILDPSFQRK